MSHPPNAAFSAIGRRKKKGRKDVGSAKQVWARATKTVTVKRGAISIRETSRGRDNNKRQCRAKASSNARK